LPSDQEKRLVFLDDDKPMPDEQDAAPRAKILPFGPRRTPDWLTGPSDDPGAAAESDAAAEDRPAPPAPVLKRPGLPPGVHVEMDPGIEPACAPVLPSPSRPGSEVADRVKAEPAAEPTKPPETPRSRMPDPAGRWAPVASSVPIPKLLLVETPEPEPAKPEAEVVVPRPTPALPGHEEDLRATAATAAAPPTLMEPWWVVALDALRTNRRAQATAVGVLALVVVLGMWMWPRGVGTTPLSQIRRHPTDFDGRSVIVRGRVGDDVFPMGAGWAFYLMQGRDTIAAFSAARRPEPRRVVTLKGQVSTGFLDGVPRQALFEVPSQQ